MVIEIVDWKGRLQAIVTCMPVSKKFNPHHDEQGRFAENGSSGGTVNTLDRDKHIELTKQLDDYLTVVAAIPRGTSDRKYSSIEALVLKEGKLLSSQDYTLDEEATLLKLFGNDRFRVKECFKNATNLALEAQISNIKNANYAEGYGVGQIPIPIQHALLTLNGKPVDVTWRGLKDKPKTSKDYLDLAKRNLKENAYRMIEVPTDFVTETIVNRGTYDSMLFDYEYRSKGHVDLLSVGIPPDWFSTTKDKKFTREELVAVGVKFNPHHDETGRFATGEGGGVVASDSYDLSDYPAKFEDIGESQRMRQASYSDVKVSMDRELSRIRNGEPDVETVTGKVDPKKISTIADNARDEIGVYSTYLAGDTAHLMHRFVNRFERDILSYSNELSDIDAGDLDNMVRDSIRKLVYQEIESNRQQFTDHGIRHITKNIEMQSSILNALASEGYDITGRERLLATFAMVNHDVGYTAPLIRDGDLRGIMASGEHQRYGEKIVQEQRSIWDAGKIFTPQEYDRIARIVRTHDEPTVDISDPIAFATRTADNLALFQAEKLPSAFQYVKSGTEHLTTMAEAWKANDKPKFETTRKKLKSAIQRSDLNSNLKRDLYAATSAISMMTPKFTMGTLAGNVSGISHSTSSLINVTIRHNAYDKFLQSKFEMGQTQLKRLLLSYGVTSYDQKRYSLGDINGKTILTIDVEGA